ncbi:MAG: DUF1972 domain-containing protein [Bacteroidia bacterium]|nr:DUF1972 domain-containing protein [Bacteroidia bacterium]
MNIGILGSRGIPNNYGGFELFAERLSVELVELGHEVWVYNSHSHPFKEKHWKGVNLIHCLDPEKYIGISGQFVYDFNCIRDSRKRDFDILLQLGYTSSSIWYRLLPEKPKIVTNMDGLEWQRSKYNSFVQRFLKYAEKLAVKSSDLLIADSEVIRDYLMQTFQVTPTYITYGADVFQTPDADRLSGFSVEPQKYLLLIARMQPDNHIEEIIRGVLESGCTLPLLIVGDCTNRYGKYMERRYSSDLVRFLGPIFHTETLNQLRYFSKLYFHGHSSGGTNPSLLEAMAASATICAHDNPFNREVLGEDAFYFTHSLEISEIIRHSQGQQADNLFIQRNVRKIKTRYGWKEIISAYEQIFSELTA